MVSARCKAKSKVLRAEVSTPPTWMVGLAYGLPASRSTMLSGAVGGFSPWTRRRSMRLAAAFWRTCMADIGSVRGRPSVCGPRRPSGVLFIPAFSLQLAGGLVELLAGAPGVQLPGDPLPRGRPGLVLQRVQH